MALPRGYHEDQAFRGSLEFHLRPVELSMNWWRFVLYAEGAIDRYGSRRERKMRKALNGTS